LARSLNFPAVTWLRNSVLCLLVAVWWPATMHCRLEFATNLEPLSCCRPYENPPAGQHHQEDCAADGCAELESGGYRPTLREPMPGPPTVALQQPSVAASTAVLRTDERAAPARPPLVPSELATAWQFSARAAPLPRSPSLCA